MTEHLKEGKGILDEETAAVNTVEKFKRHLGEY